MWVFISRHLRRWLLAAVIVPVITTLIHLVRTGLEKRSGGPTTVTRALERVERLGGKPSDQHSSAQQKSPWNRRRH